MTQMRVGRVQTHLNFSTPMNATLRRAAITAIAGFSLALTALSVQAQNAAIVNGKAIPSVRVDEFVASLTQQGRPDTPDLRNAVRDELIAREIFVQEAERKGLTRNPETQRQLESARQDILIRALIRDSLKTNPVTDADVKAEYDKVVKSSGGQEYRARHILVETEPEAKAIIDQLKKGQTTETPIKSDFGWHVIRLDDVRDTQAPPLEQVKPQIQQELERRRIQTLQADLRAKAKIQ